MKIVILVLKYMLGNTMRSILYFRKSFLQKWITDLIALKDICNPFEEAELIVSDAGEIIIPEIQLCLGCLLEISKEIYQNFCKNTLIICDAANMAT